MSVLGRRERKEGIWPNFIGAWFCISSNSGEKCSFNLPTTHVSCSIYQLWSKLSRSGCVGLWPLALPRNIVTKSDLNCILAFSKYNPNCYRQVAKLTCNECVSYRLCSFVETRHHQVEPISSSRRQTSQLIDCGCAFRGRHRWDVSVIYDRTVNDVRGTKVPAQHGARLLNIGATKKRRNIRLWNRSEQFEAFYLIHHKNSATELTCCMSV